MSDRHEVIAAFLDDEPFDGSQLTAALSDPGGRELLLDILALRHLVQSRESEMPSSLRQQPTRPALQALIAVAALLVALVGGYLLGRRPLDMALSDAPPATRVVEAPAPWQEVPRGRMR